MLLCFYETAGKSFQKLTLSTGFSLLEGFLESSEGCQHASMVCSLLCSVNLFPKYLILAVQLRKKQLCEATTLPFQGRLPIAPISCLIVNKSVQVRLKNGKHINLKRKKYQANMFQNRFELCGSKLQKIQCKTVSVKLRFSVMFTVLIQQIYLASLKTKFVNYRVTLFRSQASFKVPHRL